jgi:hypothetical protein
MKNFQDYSSLITLLDNLVDMPKDGGVAQGEPPGGLGEGVLASQLTLLQPFGKFCVGRL